MFQRPPATTDTQLPLKGGTEGGRDEDSDRERIKRCELMGKNKRDISQVGGKNERFKKDGTSLGFFSSS